MSDATFDPVERLARHQRLQSAMELVLGKLRRDPKTITTEDVRSLTDNAEEADTSTAEVIAAVADVVARNKEEQAVKDNKASCSVNLSKAVEDLLAAVKALPGEVNTDILKITQSIVSSEWSALLKPFRLTDANIVMQKAIGHTNAPHPELEAEFQQEYAKIIPKVERGVVTKAEADHLHSLEARAYGHTEKGGLTATAQSVAARRESQTSISGSSNGVRSRTNSHALTPQEGFHTHAGAALPETEIPPAELDIDAAAMKSQQSKEDLFPKKAPEMHGGVSPKSSMRRFHSLSDFTNATHSDIRYDAMFPKLQSYGSVNTGGGSENIPHRSRPESSHPTV